MFANAQTVRPVPGQVPTGREAEKCPEEERRHAAALMRVNHCGEICAQALYQGRPWMSDNEDIKKAPSGAAWWGDRAPGLDREAHRRAGRAQEPAQPRVWRFAGHRHAAARFGDRANLGFLPKPNVRSRRILKSHLTRLPEQDLRSRRSSSR